MRDPLASGANPGLQDRLHEVPNRDTEEVAHPLSDRLELGRQERLVGGGPCEDKVADVQNRSDNPEHLELFVVREANDAEGVLE